METNVKAFEVVCRGTSVTGQIITSHWYHITTPDTPDAQDLTDLLDVYQTDMQPKYLAAMVNTYTLQEVACYGWDPVTWVRTPFLPLVRSVNLAGTSAPTGQTNGYSCAIFSCKVEPSQPSKQRDPETGAIVDRPVRRGYVAHGPLNEDWLEPSGYILGVMLSNAAWVAYRNQLKTQLFHATKLPTPADPIRVGKPVKGQTQKGWGYIRDVVIRPEVRVRRSRLVKVGN